MEDKLVFGLIGFPLNHSRSPALFHDKFAREGIKKAEYRLFPLPSIGQLPLLLRDFPDLAGLNVTIPYKEEVIPFLDELDDTARCIGAVNTIRITRRDGRVFLKGYNTDSIGFLRTLTNSIPDGPALILGTGGAAKAVSFALNQKNIPFSFVSRNRKGAGIVRYGDLTPEMISHHRLIINTTPLGMYPDTGSFPPIPFHLLSEGHFLYDLVYNPEETEFLKRGKALNAHTMNGIQMLIHQAELSFKIFLGK